MTSKVKEAVKYVSIVLLSLLVILCVYSFFVTDILKNDYVDIFGYSYFVISSGSMSGDAKDSIDKNDIIVVKITQNVEKEDVITFKSKRGDLVTHRVKNIEGDTLITRGDANNVDDEPIKRSSVIGKVVNIISPSFILKCVAILIIIFVFFALLGFDGFMEKDKVVDDDKEKLKTKNNKKLAERFNELKSKNKNKDKKEVSEVKNVEKPKVENNVSTPVKEEAKQVVVPKQETPVKKEEKPSIPFINDNKTKSGPSIESLMKVEQIDPSKDKPVAVKLADLPSSHQNDKAIDINMDKAVVVPESIFKTDKEPKKKDLSETVVIPTEELEELKYFSYEEEELSFIDPEGELFNLDETIQLNRNNIVETQLVESIYNLLRIKHKGLSTTRINLEWLVRYQYVYRLAQIVDKNDIKQFKWTIKKPTFDEVYNYDIDEIGLYESIRNQICVMPVYTYLWIMLFCVIYNDLEYYDAMYKMLKFRLQIEKASTIGNFFRKDKTSVRETKRLIKLMNKISRRYDNKKVFNLEEVEKRVKEDAYLGR